VIVGVCKLTFRLSESHELKSKRRVIGSVCSRVRNKFNVSVSEVDYNESWKMATLGVTCSSNSARHVDDVLSQVVSFIADTRLDLELVDQQQETISGF